MDAVLLLCCCSLLGCICVYLIIFAIWSGAPCFMLETVFAIVLGRHLHHSVTHAVYFIQCSCMFSVHLSCIHITFWSLSCLHFLVSVPCSLVIALCCITIITSCSLHVACSLHLLDCIVVLPPLKKNCYSDYLSLYSALSWILCVIWVWPCAELLAVLLFDLCTRVGGAVHMCTNVCMCTAATYVQPVPDKMLICTDTIKNDDEQPK